MISVLDGYRDGLAAGELRLPHCASCQHVQWPPRDVCPQCHSVDQVWRLSSRTAKIVTWTVIHRAALADFTDLAPYAVAVLELIEEQVRILGRVDGPPERMVVGGFCTWSVIDGPDGSAVPVWYLTGGE